MRQLEPLGHFKLGLWRAKTSALVLGGRRVGGYHLFGHPGLELHRVGSRRQCPVHQLLGEFHVSVVVYARLSHDEAGLTWTNLPVVDVDHVHFSRLRTVGMAAARLCSTKDPTVEAQLRRATYSGQSQPPLGWALSLRVARRSAKMLVEHAGFAQYLSAGRHLGLWLVHSWHATNSRRPRSRMSRRKNAAGL